MSVCRSVCLSVGLSVCRSVGLSVCRSVGLSEECPKNVQKNNFMTKCNIYIFHHISSCYLKEASLNCVFSKGLGKLGWRSNGFLRIILKLPVTLRFVYICSLPVNVWKCVWKNTINIWRKCCYTSTGRWSSLFFLSMTGLWIWIQLRQWGTFVGLPPSSASFWS